MRLRRKSFDAVGTEWMGHGDHLLVKEFPVTRLTPMPHSTLSCCGRSYREHGHMGEYVVCPGMWILEDPAGVFAPSAGTKEEALAEFDLIEEQTG